MSGVRAEHRDETVNRGLLWGERAGCQGSGTYVMWCRQEVLKDKENSVPGMTWTMCAGRSREGVSRARVGWCEGVDGRPPRTGATFGVIKKPLRPGTVSALCFGFLRPTVTIMSPTSTAPPRPPHLDADPPHTHPDNTKQGKKKHPGLSEQSALHWSAAYTTHR